MKLNLALVIAGSLACDATLAAVTETTVAAESKITILYDAFGDDAAMKKDWGFSALVEVAGKRILFDTGNDRDIFAANHRSGCGSVLLRPASRIGERRLFMALSTKADRAARNSFSARLRRSSELDPR